LIRLDIDRRVLGAVDFVDATTGASIGRPLRVRTEARVYRQRSGLLVIADAPGLHEHSLAFAAAPAEPPVGSVPVQLAVSDPAGEYLATTVTIALPRNPDPAAGDRVHLPLRVKLWRSGAAPVLPNWTVYQATLLHQGSDTPLAGALLTLEAAGQTLHALSDATGQATLALVGQPLFTLAGGGTVSRTLSAVLSVRANRPPAEPLADVEAEIARLSATAAHATFNRTLPTGAATQEVLPIAV
jgi:hypothetical protein